MHDHEPTVRSRELGEGLNRAMRRAKLDQKGTARLLGWSQSRVSRLLSGKRGGTEVDVSAFLAIVQVTGAERDRLLGICREQNVPGWLQQHGARLARQSLFTRERPARFSFYLHEAALRLPVGGAAVLAEQLRHLLRKSARPYLTLQVVPASYGAHAATAGPFILMEFAGFRPVVYLESATSCVFLEEPEQIAAYRSILGALAETALSAEESAELIATLATELYPDREDHHDPA